jgi:hypothetical protein
MGYLVDQLSSEGPGSANGLRSMHRGRKLFDFVADGDRIRPLKTCEGQFYSPISACAIEAKIHNGNAPELSVGLHI